MYIHDNGSKTAILVLGLAFFFALTPGMAQTLPALDHPRLFFSGGQLDAYRERLADDPVLKSMDQRLIEVADSLLPMPVESRQMVGRRLLHSSRTVLKRMLLLGYAYRMTGREKYFDRAREELLSAADYRDWNPDHFLDVAEMTTALAIGYDWFYDRLSPTDRKLLADAVYGKAMRPALDDPGWWVTTTNNWNQVCNGGLAVGAIAFYEAFPATADSIIQRGYREIDRAYEQYAPDGAYAEGASYYNYGTSFHAMFLDAYTLNYPDRPPLNIPPYFLASGRFMAQIRGPRGYYNYGDSRAADHPYPSIYWMAQAGDTSGILYYQYPLLRAIATGEDRLVAAGDGDRLLPLAPIWLARLEMRAEQRPPVTTTFTSAGMNPISVYRTSFSDTATFVAMKGGTPSMNHGHMDIGSFVVDDRGHRWVFDPGMHDYNALEKEGMSIFDRSQTGDRWKVNRYTNFVHSTLTVNGRHQRVDGFAHLAALSRTAGWRATRIRMDSVYSGDLGSATRVIALHDSGAILVNDRISAPADTAALVRWAILVGDQLSVIDDSTAVLRQGEKRMLVRVLSPTNVSLRTFSSQPKLPFERGLPDTMLLGFTTALEKSSAVEITILLADPDNVEITTGLASDLLNKLKQE